MSFEHQIILKINDITKIDLILISSSYWYLWNLHNRQFTLFIINIIIIKYKRVLFHSKLPYIHNRIAFRYIGRYFSVHLNVYMICSRFFTKKNDCITNIITFFFKYTVGNTTVRWYNGIQVFTDEVALYYT